MAQLGNGEVQVDRPRNESKNGDSGRRARSPKSAYLLVGGSSDTYSVTVNFATGHFCKKDGEKGAMCQGNMNGKARNYGHVSKRDTRNAVEWCKHVKAAMANTEALSEAQEITATTFGRKQEPAPVAPPVPVAVIDPAIRLAEINTEMEALRGQIVAEKVAALFEEHGREAVLEAIKAA